MARFQRLSSVCNGGHIHDLYTIQTIDDLKKAMRNETKAILIVGGDQANVLRVLESIRGKRSGLRAKLVGKWSPRADLWFVKC